MGSGRMSRTAERSHTTPDPSFTAELDTTPDPSLTTGPNDTRPDPSLTFMLGHTTANSSLTAGRSHITPEPTSLTFEPGHTTADPTLTTGRSHITAEPTSLTAKPGHTTPHGTSLTTQPSPVRGAAKPNRAAAIAANPSRTIPITSAIGVTRVPTAAAVTIRRAMPAALHLTPCGRTTHDLAGYLARRP
jgi:hypothetical protein